MSAYPKAFKTWRRHTDYTEYFYAQQMNDLQAEVVALQQVLGVNPHHGVGADAVEVDYASIDDRINREGPSVVVTATSQYPYTMVTTVDGAAGQPRVAWESVTTTVDGTTTTSSYQPTISLPPNRPYLLHFEAIGFSVNTGMCEFEVYSKRTTTQLSNRNTMLVPTPNGCYVEAVLLPDDGSVPPGSGWYKDDIRTDPLVANGAPRRLWCRTRPIGDYAPFTLVDTWYETLVWDQVALTNGQWCSYNVSDIPIGSSASTDLSLRFGPGLQVPDVRLTVMSLDHPAVLP